MKDLKPYEIPGHPFYVDKATAPVHWHKLPFHKAAVHVIKSPGVYPFLISLCVSSLAFGVVLPYMVVDDEYNKQSAYRQKQQRRYDYTKEGGH